MSPAEAGIDPSTSATPHAACANAHAGQTGRILTKCPHLLAEQDLETLLEAGRRAPSPDNNQPWAFRAGATGVDVFHVARRAVRSDCNGLFSWLALGAAIENIVLAGSSLRYQGAVVYEDGPLCPQGEVEHICTVRFGPAAEPDPLYAHIQARCTNRRPYSRRPLSESSSWRFVTCLARAHLPSY